MQMLAIVCSKDYLHVVITVKVANLVIKVLGRILAHYCYDTLSDSRLRALFLFPKN